MKKRLFSMLLVLCMVFTLFPSAVFAEKAGVTLGTSSITEGASLCENHKTHDKDCGYIEAKEAQSCGDLLEDGSYSCAPVKDDGDVATSSEIKEKYVCDHNDNCGYAKAVEGADCTHECDLCLADNADKDIIADTCVCEALCTESLMNPECKLCTAEGADLAACKGKAPALLATPRAPVTGYSYDPGTTTLTIDSDIGTTAWRDDSSFTEASVTTVEIQSSVTEIKTGAFYGCSSLESVTFEGATPPTFGTNVFTSTASTLKIYVPTAAAVTAYKDVANLATWKNRIVIMGSSAIIGEGYSYDPDSKTLTIFSDIGTNAWKGSNTSITISDVTTVVIESGVTDIGFNSFNGCTSLESVTIPNSVTIIGHDAFYGCTNLASVIIPESVITIGESAFRGCTSLESVTIPSDVTKIDRSAFQHCSKLASVTFEGATPPTIFGEGVFENTHADLKIYVPSASVDNYKAVSNLAAYASRIEAKSEPTTKITTSLDLGRVSADVKCTDSDVADKITGMTQHTHEDNTPCWAWNTTTSTLTLNNVDIDLTGTAANTAIELGGNGVKMVLMGNNRVLSGGANSRNSKAIACNGALDISGDGTLDATASSLTYDSDSSTESLGIYTVGKLTISGGTVTATSGDVTSNNTTEDPRRYSFGIWGYGGISITGGTVTATSGTVTSNGRNKESCGIVSDQPIELSGGTVTAKAVSGNYAHPFGIEPTLTGMVHKAGTGTWDNTAGTACVYEKGTAVTVPVTGVTLNKSTISLYSNTNPRSETLTKTVAPSNATNKAVTWSSSNPAVATVVNGTVTAVANGTATITVTTADGGFTASCTVTVSTYSSGGSTGGGSSSGGSSNIIITPPAPDKPNNPTQAEIKVETKTDANGNTSIKVTDKNINDAYDKALADAKKNGNTANGVTIVLSATGGKNAKSVTVNLPKTVQDLIISKKVVSTIIVVDNPDVQIGMDLKAVTEINAQAKSDVNITAQRLDSSKLTGNAQTAIGSRPGFDLAVNYGSGMQVQNFGAGGVSVSIPYTLGANEKAENVCAVYVENDGNVQWLTSSVYDSTAKVLRFSTNHFSIYGVGYKQDTPAFTDTQNHWAKADIEYVVSRGLLSGTGTTTFSPDTPMTRGMFVTALGKLANADVSSYKTNSFSDVKADSYYIGYIEWANKNGIANGSDGKFMPDQSITREQMAVIMQNYANVIGFTLPKVYEEKAFADSAKISDYARDAVKTMQMAGILSGKSGDVFEPQGTVTRAEVSAILRRFIEMRISINTV